MLYTQGVRFWIYGITTMKNSLDHIANQIAGCVEKIEEYQHEIIRLRKKIREFSWLAIEADDSEIRHFDEPNP
jgi:NADH:ubiquinone oxidoreductase subunit B-like Fe-S oxidoreductase